MTSNLPKISIITVVYNSVSYLESTILSVLEQDYPEIEHIIIDGNSTDGTLDIIKKYENKIAFCLSEPDKGIYDAMNKGLKNAKGNYVWFINSGDIIFSKSTVSEIIEQDKNADVYYGETMMIDEKGKKIGLRRLKTPENLTWKSLSQGMLVSHQSFLVRREIAPFYKLQYRCSADYDWVLESLKKAKIIHNTHLVLSKFLDGGFTKQNIVAGLKERFKIMTKTYGFVPTLFRHFKIGFKFLFYVLKNKRF